MSAFTETALMKKLGDLNSSQQAIQTLSLWLIHHRKHHSAIIKTWLKELQTVTEGKKLTFMYLANDVVQNSKKKGPEYGKEFATVLPRVFSHIGETCSSDKVYGSLGRILNIWEERGVYDAKTIKEFRTRMHKHRKEQPSTSSGNASASAGGGSSVTASNAAAVAGDTNHTTKTNSHEKREKRKHDDGKTSSKSSKKHRHGEEKSTASAASTSTTSANNANNEHGSGVKSNSKTAAAATPPTTTASSNITPSSAASSGTLNSPYVPIGEPPEPEELIRALTSMENTASRDAIVRERIANMPEEISDVSCLSKLQDKDAAKVLSKQVNEAVELLHNYNARLAAEMEERHKLATMLREYQAEQVELLAQADQRLEEYKVKLTNLLSVQKEINSHLSNLPDLTQLPDVTGGLAPLPSAGDLFNIHT